MVYYSEIMILSELEDWENVWFSDEFYFGYGLTGMLNFVIFD